MTRSTARAVIIGAGPYGLAAAAHLRAANVETHVFGETMSFWTRQMPQGMVLRSPWNGSHIADPQHALTLDRFAQECGIPQVRHLPLADFLRYGHWFQRQIAPDVDSRRVLRVERSAAGFTLSLEDGQSLHAERVIVAAGIGPFRYRPPQFDGLPASLASHASEHDDLGRFSGQRVAVVGGGQSALESAVLLAEAGAEVESLVRAPSIHWLGGFKRALRRLGPLEGLARRVLVTKADVGPPGVNWIISTPRLFQRFPWGQQERMTRRALRPAGADWLVPRVGAVRFTLGRRVLSAAAAGEQVLLRLDDGSERQVDHVLLGTGYRVNIARYPFLAPELVQEVRSVDGHPELNSGFETSVPGLYFLGAPAARSFGPLMRFVAGTEFAAPALTRGVLRRKALPAYSPVRAPAQG